MIVAQNSANRERIDGAKAAATTSKETKADTVLWKRKAVNDENLNTLENDSKRMKGKMEKDNKAKVKNELAIEDARYILEKTIMEQNLRTLKVAGKGTLGLHEKKVLNHQFQIDLYQLGLNHFKRYFEIKGNADEIALSDDEESDTEGA